LTSRAAAKAASSRRTPRRAFARDNSDIFRGLNQHLSPAIFSVEHLISELPVARVDVVHLFGRNAPLHVDLGCGDGSFLCQMAQQFPKRNFLGIERLSKRVEKVRCKAEKIENVRVLRAETLFAVRYLLPESSVDTFYLLFPDPWPKRRHQFRRIFTRDFLDAIAVALERHGVLCIATDQLDYFHQIERLSRAHLQFQVVTPAPDDAVLPVTKFERKFREEGAPIYRLTLRKTSPVR
jgi:tRNA (guanine-N7-)-methyltransferase